MHRAASVLAAALAALAGLAALAVAGCQRSPSAPGAGAPAIPGEPPATGSPGGDLPEIVPPATSAPSASLSIVDPAGGSGPFRLDELEALHVRLRYTGPAGVHTGRIDVVDPHGTLFAQLPVTLEVTASGPAAADAAAEAKLRIRGTPVELLHQIGTWQLNASVDRTPLASATIDLTGAPAR